MKTPLLSTAIIMVSFVVGLQARAQDPATKAWTLDEFVKKSVESSQTVEVKKLTYEQNDAAVDEKSSAFLPTVNATASSYKSGNENGIADTGQNITSSSLNQAYTQTKVNFSANLFNGLQDSSNLKAAKHQRTGAQLNWADARYTQVANSIEAYFAVLQYESDLKNQQKEIEINEQSLKETQRKLRYGGARKTEVISLQSTIATNKINMVATQSSLNQGRLTALRLINLGDEPLQLKYEPGRCGAENIQSIIARMDPKKRADYKALGATTDAADATLSATKGKNFPTIDFTTSYVLSDSQAISQQGSYNMALTLTIPFPFGFESRAQVAQAAKSLAIAKMNQEKSLLDLQQSRDGLIRQLLDDLANIKSLAEAKILNEQNVKAMKEDHRSGISTYSDVLSASTTYQQTIRQYDKAVLQLDLDCYRALVWSADENQLLESFKGESI